MNKLTKEDVNNLKNKLKIQYPKGRVEYIGCNRFKVALKHQIEIEGRSVLIDKYFLYDIDLKEILEARKFDTIYRCTNGFITVSKNSLPTFSEDDTFSRTKKFGLIDINGKEILPCEYESASAKLDGLVELRREGIDFFVPIEEILEEEYVWEVYRDFYKKRNQ